MDLVDSKSMKQGETPWLFANKKQFGNMSRIGFNPKDLSR